MPKQGVQNSLLWSKHSTTDHSSQTHLTCLLLFGGTLCRKDNPPNMSSRIKTSTVSTQKRKCLDRRAHPELLPRLLWGFSHFRFKQLKILKLALCFVFKEAEAHSGKGSDGPWEKEEGPLMPPSLRGGVAAAERQPGRGWPDYLRGLLSGLPAVLLAEGSSPGRAGTPAVCTTVQSWQWAFQTRAMGEAEPFQEGWWLSGELP